MALRSDTGFTISMLLPCDNIHHLNCQLSATVRLLMVMPCSSMCSTTSAAVFPPSPTMALIAHLNCVSCPHRPPSQPAC